MPSSRGSGRAERARRRTRLLLPLLVIAGLACRASPEHHAAKDARDRPEPAPSTAPHLAWDPPLEDVLAVGRAALAQPVELKRCDAAGETCEVLQNFGTGEVILDWEPSPSGRSVFVWHRLDGRPSVLEIFDVASGRRRGQANPGGDPQLGDSSQLRWIDDETLLYLRSAGSHTSVAEVYGDDGRSLLSVDAPGLQLSSSRRYLAALPALGTPLAEDRSLRVFDLRQGKLVAKAGEEQEFRHVFELCWKPSALEFSYEDVNGERGAGHLELPE